MWRPAHGATNRPGPSRPTNGYGRVLGRPGPRSDVGRGEGVPVGALDPSQFAVRAPDQEAEAPAPVTP
jgi:hypothetical protein